ncbi:MAG: MraY family glycosyltransferase [Candidatus Omnitrophota bacterium]
MYIYLLFVSFVVTFMCLPVSIGISNSLGIFSRPKKGERKGLPCLGGLAIFVGFLIAILIFYRSVIGLNYKIFGLIISSGLIILLGFLDDAKDLPPLMKIMIEVVAIIFLIMSGVSTKIVFLPMWLNGILTIVWMLLIINAFNLLDIADGLAAGLAVIVSGTLLIIALVKGDIFSSLVLIALIGSSLGFLMRNHPPAKLYMGDTGSLFIGFIVGAIAINISYAPMDRPIALLTPLLALSLPIYDTLFLMIMRVKKKKIIFKKTDDHFTLRLIKKGYSVTKSVHFMYSFSIFIALCSLVVAFGSNLLGSIAVILVVIVFILMGKKIGMVKIDD